MKNDFPTRVFFRSLQPTFPGLVLNLLLRAFPPLQINEKINLKDGKCLHFSTLPEYFCLWLSSSTYLKLHIDDFTCFLFRQMVIEGAQMLQDRLARLNLLQNKPLFHLKEQQRMLTISWLFLTMRAFITSCDYGSETQTQKDSLTVGFITIKHPDTSSCLWSVFILLDVSEAELVEDWNRIWFCTISEFLNLTW